jgi:hypothetical protein
VHFILEGELHTDLRILAKSELLVWLEIEVSIFGHSHRQLTNFSTLLHINYNAIAMFIIVNHGEHAIHVSRHAMVGFDLDG